MAKQKISLTTILSCILHTGRHDHENHEHRDFGEKHARSMRCSERGMWQKTREIARYDERDEPEQGNKGMERHGDIRKGVKRESKSPMIPENVLHNNTFVTLLFFLRSWWRCSWLYISGLS